ncbi:MAG: hypothetical protein ACP5KN_18460 [Armatimonadota bacterium]
METWVTVGAQIFNFLVLVVALHYLLYGPITRAMDEREERIARRMREAQEREEEAEEEARRHRKARREFEERHGELMDEARQEAQRRREELIEQTREEIEALQKQWSRALRDEREAFLRELRRRTSQQVCTVARRALRDLADVELQRQITDVFIQRLREVPDDERDQLRDALRTSERPPVIASAFQVPPQRRDELVAATRELLATEQQVDFRVSEDLLCGIELSAGGRKLSWSIDSYLDAVEESITEALERELAEEPREESTEAALSATDGRSPEREGKQSVQEDRRERAQG